MFDTDEVLPGIRFMKTLMDEVRFERGGAVVYMRKNPIQLAWAVLSSGKQYRHQPLQPAAA
jgi:hypothetical protein